MVLIDLSKAFDSLCHSNYKIWVLPTKPFFTSKVILQTDNSPLVLQLHCQNRTTHYYTWCTSGINSEKTKFVLFGVRQLISKLPTNIILNSLVFSKLFYCSTVWSGTSKENIHKLQHMQNFTSGILTNTKKFDPITPVLHELGWLTIEELLRL